MPMNFEEVNNLWYDSKSINGVTFGLDDSVRVISGEYAGKSASVISIISIEPIPIYLVELGDGGLMFKFLKLNWNLIERSQKRPFLRQGLRQWDDVNFIIKE